MTLIKPTYVTFEQAKKFKEKNFNVKCETKFEINGDLSELNALDGALDWNNTKFSRPLISRPEQWQVVEWLRINRGINILPIESYTYPDEIKNRWKYQIINKQEKNKDIFNKKFFIESDYEFQSPQESYSAAFDYVLNNLI